MQPAKNQGNWRKNRSREKIMPIPDPEIQPHCKKESLLATHFSFDFKNDMFCKSLIILYDFNGFLFETKDVN